MSGDRNMYYEDTCLAQCQCLRFDAATVKYCYYYNIHITTRILAYTGLIQTDVHIPPPPPLSVSAYLPLLCLI